MHLQGISQYISIMVLMIQFKFKNNNQFQNIMQMQKFKQLQKEIKSVKQANSSHINILKKFEQYANLSNDKLAVFQYMQTQKICVQLRQFWYMFSNIYFQIGDYENSLKAIQICKNIKDDDSICSEKIMQSQNKLIQQLTNAVKQNIAYRSPKSLLLYEALKAMDQQKNMKKQKYQKLKFINDQKKKNLQIIIQAYKKYCEEYIYQKIQQQQQANHQKFKPFMKSQQSSLKKIKKSLTNYKSRFGYQNNQIMKSNINALSPKNILNKTFRTKTEDSIQLQKKRKKKIVKINKQGQNEDQQQINYNTTSMVQLRKRVHFILNSDKKNIYKTDNKKIEKFRSLNLSSELKVNFMNINNSENQKEEINN